MAKRGEVVYVVIDDEGKLHGVYAIYSVAMAARDACDGKVYIRTIE